MNISETPVDDIILQNIPGAAAEGAKLISISIDAPAVEIVNAINQFVSTPAKKRWFRKTDHWNERAMPLGALWGTQMVRAFAWEWASVVQHDHNDFKAVGVFDKKRSVGSIRSSMSTPVSKRCLPYDRLGLQHARSWYDTCL